MHMSGIKMAFQTLSKQMWIGYQKMSKMDLRNNRASKASAMCIQMLAHHWINQLAHTCTKSLIPENPLGNRRIDLQNPQTIKQLLHTAQSLTTELNSREPTHTQRQERQEHSEQDMLRAHLRQLNAPDEAPLPPSIPEMMAWKKLCDERLAQELGARVSQKEIKETIQKILAERVGHISAESTRTSLLQVLEEGEFNQEQFSDELKQQLQYLDAASMSYMHLQMITENLQTINGSEVQAWLQSHAKQTLTEAQNLEESQEISETLSMQGIQLLISSWEKTQQALTDLHNVGDEQNELQAALQVLMETQHQELPQKVKHAQQIGKAFLKQLGQNKQAVDISHNLTMRIQQDLSNLTHTIRQNSWVIMATIEHVWKAEEAIQNALQAEENRRIEEEHAMLTWQSRTPQNGLLQAIETRKESLKKGMTGPNSLILYLRNYLAYLVPNLGSLATWREQSLEQNRAALKTQKDQKQTLQLLQEIEAKFQAFSQNPQSARESTTEKSPSPFFTTVSIGPISIESPNLCHAMLHPQQMYREIQHWIIEQQSTCKTLWRQNSLLKLCGTWVVSGIAHIAIAQIGIGIHGKKSTIETLISVGQFAILPSVDKISGLAKWIGIALGAKLLKAPTA